MTFLSFIGALVLAIVAAMILWNLFCVLVWLATDHENRIDNLRIRVGILEESAFKEGPETTKQERGKRVSKNQRRSK